MNQTTTTEAPAEASVEPKAKPQPLTLPGSKVSTRELTPADGGVPDSVKRPYVVDIARQTAPVAHMGEAVVRGSPEQTKAEIKRLQALEKAQEKAERDRQAEAKSRAAEWERLEKGARDDLRREVDAMFARCPGKPTSYACVPCSSLPPMFKRIFLHRAGTMVDEERTASIGVVLFPMKRQPTGLLRCPRCGVEQYLAGG